MAGAMLAGMEAFVASAASACSSDRGGPGSGPDAAVGDSGSPAADSSGTTPDAALEPTSDAYGGTQDGALDTVSEEGAAGEASAGCSLGPQTLLHYTSGWAGDNPGLSLGFNLADVSSASAASALPAGVQALVWLGLCNGADSTFVSIVQPFIGNSNVYGFYVMDEPDPTGQFHPPACPAANLKAEADWIHANVPGAKTFIILMNMGSDDAPSYDMTYNPTNSDIDLYGLDPYPCQVAYTSCHYAQLAASVAAARSWGIPDSAMVPVYQAFGGGGYAQWRLPTPDEERTILITWASVTPRPPFDYAYAWASQLGDTALGQSPQLQPIFAAQNAGTCVPGGD